jgi:hypothetical protein
MIFAYSISEPGGGTLATCGSRGYDADRRWRATGSTDAKLARAAAARVAEALIREYGLERLYVDISAISGCPVGNRDRRVWTRWGEDTTPHPGNVWTEWNPKHRDWKRP